MMRARAASNSAEVLKLATPLFFFFVSLLQNNSTNDTGASLFLLEKLRRNSSILSAMVARMNVSGGTGMSAMIILLLESSLSPADKVAASLTGSDL